MKKHIFIICIQMLLFTVACIPVPTKTSNPNVNQTVTEQPPISTTLQVNSPTFPPSQTPVPVSTLINKCLEIKPSISSNLKINGFIVIVNQYGEDYKLLDLKTARISPIAGDQNEIVIRLLVSPNGEKIAYLLDSEGRFPLIHELVISALDGPKTVIPWQNNWIRWGWLDNDRLIVGKADNRFGSYMTIRANSGQIEEIPLNNINDDSVWPSVYHYTNQENKTIETSFAEMFFEPTLTRVIHFGYIDTPHYQQTLLRDLGHGKILANFPNILNIPDFSSSRVSYPVWSPNGKSFLIEASDNDEARDLYEVSRDGEIKQLTYLTNTYKQVRVQNYSFSSDQRYIAFWLLTDLYKEYHLAVMDTTTKEITDTCLPAYVNNSDYIPSSAFWAPNSHQFVIETNPTVEMPLTVLVDLDHYIAMKVSENMIPHGWLASP